MDIIFTIQTTSDSLSRQNQLCTHSKSILTGLLRQVVLGESNGPRRQRSTIMIYSWGFKLLEIYSQLRLAFLNG